MMQRSMCTSWTKYPSHFDKHCGLNDSYYIVPNEYPWDDACRAEMNTLKSETGNFTVMYRGEFQTEVQVDAEGVFTFSASVGRNRCGFI